MAFEWVAGLFQSDNQQTRGLSGDSAHTVALDESNPYYNYRLRRHKAEGDLIADPALVWYTSPYVKRRSGLGTHVGAEIGDGTANYTDVLLILSREDWARASGEWQQSAIRTLQQEFDNFCRRENFNRLHAHRPLGVRILEDASPAMGGQSLGLQRGEFVSGLLPNLYTGPVRGSFPVIGVHVNMPGVWEGYQEVGRLYNDQILFTLGNHWLDNFSHPSLQQAALYRLRQYPDGSFVHIINPDLQDRYQVTSTNQGGASVLTLATRAGQPLAYLVLAVIDPPSAKPSQPPTRAPQSARPDITMPRPPATPTPAAQRSPPSKPAPPASKSPVREPIPSIAPPMMLDDAPPTGGAGGGIGLGGKTIIPDAPNERIFTFQERGALLQKVHFSAFMLGYDVYLGPRGELGTHVEDPAATFQVRKRSVSLVAHVDGVMVGGRPVPAGVEVPIEGDVKIEVAGQKLEYRDMRGLQADGWPYVGEIRRPASSTYMIWGEDYQVGRSRECRVVLPDEPRNDNIHWKPSVGDGATIRARTGEIPKSRFYTDSIMVASEHAAVDLRGDVPRLLCTARHCYLYVRRNGEVYPLYPATSPQQPKEMDLLPGDEVLVGNCLFHVGFTAGDAVAPAPAPKIELNSDSLSSSVAAPDLRALEKGSVPPPPPRETIPSVPPPMMIDDDEEPPGPPPPPEEAPEIGDDREPPAPPVRPVGMDSILYDDLSPTSTAPPLGLDGPIEIGDDDEPTIPGLIMPRDAFDDGPAWDEGSAPAAQVDADLSVDVSADDRGTDDVAGWDAEDWSEEPAAPRAAAPTTPPETGPAEVPPPVPEVEHDELPAEPTAELPEEEFAATLEALPPTVEQPPPLIDEPPPLIDEPPPLIDEPPPLIDEPATEAKATPPTAPPVAEAKPTPTPAAPRLGAVVATDDADAQFEIGRPMHLILAGWTVNGEVVCGNHDAADLVIPENRIDPDQQFAPRDYFRLKVRGRKGHLEVLAPTEVLVDEDDPKALTYDDPEAHVLDVIRRDDSGEEDFAVRLKLVEEKRLPDPRARFVSIDYADPLAAALVTRGLPKGAPRTLEIGGLTLTLKYDGATITITDYLDSYRRGSGFHPFFVQRGDERFKTAPEDGSPLELRSGDRLVVGHCVWVLREE